MCLNCFTPKTLLHNETRQLVVLEERNAYDYLDSFIILFPQEPLMVDACREIIKNEMKIKRSGSSSLGSPSFTMLANHFIFVKMEENVVLIWKNIAILIPRSYKLENHLTGTRIPDQSVDIPPCEDYLEEVFSQVLCCDMAKELWDSLLEYYDVRAKSKEIYNRQTMQRTVKGGNVRFNRGRNHESRPTCQPRNTGRLSALTVTTENLNDQRCNPNIGNDHTSKVKIMNG